MDINSDDLRIVLDSVQFLATGAIAIYAWSTSRTKATTGAINRIETRIVAAENRILVCEQDIKHLPTSDDIKELNQVLTSLHGDLKKLQGNMTLIGSRVERINEHLLDKSV